MITFLSVHITQHGFYDDFPDVPMDADDSDTEDESSLRQDGDPSSVQNDPGLYEKENFHTSEQIPDDAVLVLCDHKSETLAVAASPCDRNLIITGGMDDVGLVWNLETQSSIAVNGAKDSVSTVAFSHDGTYAALGAENGAVLIVCTDTADAPSTPLDGPGDAVLFLCWHPRGPVLLAGSADNVAYMWNAAKARFMMAFAGHEDSVSCGRFSANGKLVVTGSLDSSVRVWNPSEGTTLVRIQTGVPGLRGVFHVADVHCLSVGSENSTASMLIASGCAAGEVIISHCESGQLLFRLPRHEGGVESVEFAPSFVKPVLLATAGADGIIRLWDVNSSQERFKFVQGGVITKVVWHPQKPLIASASSSGTIGVWNCLSGEKLRLFTGHRAFISDLCFVGDNKFVASTSGDGTVRIFDIREFVSNSF